MTIEVGRMIASHMSYPDDMEVEDLARITIDSLMAIAIRSWCRRHAGINVPLAGISNSGTVGTLSKVIVKILREKYEKGASVNILLSSTALPDELEMLGHDTDLGRTIQAASGPVPDWLSEDEGWVFFIGAIGFLGFFLLSSLAHLPQVKTIACLIRAPDSEKRTSQIYTYPG